MESAGLTETRTAGSRGVEGVVICTVTRLEPGSVPRATTVDRERERSSQLGGAVCTLLPSWMRVWPDHVSAGVACVREQLEALQTGISGWFPGPDRSELWDSARDWVPYSLSLSLSLSLSGLLVHAALVDGSRCRAGVGW